MYIYIYRICSPTPQDLLEVCEHTYSMQILDKKSTTVQALAGNLDRKSTTTPSLYHLNLNDLFFPVIAWFITFNQPTNQRQVKRSKSRERGVTGVVGVPWLFRVGGKGMAGYWNGISSGEWPHFFLIFPAQTAGVIKWPIFWGIKQCKHMVFF